MTKQKSKRRVIFFPSDEGACAKYRCWIPSIGLNSAGVFARYAYKWRPKMLDEFDVFIFQRSYNRKALDLAVSLRLKGKLTVLDIDDDLLTIPVTNPVFWDFLRNPKLVWITLVLARLVDVVTTTTEQLKQLLEQFVERVIVVPNFLNLEEHQDVQPVRLPEKRIWMFWGGSNTHLAALQLLEAPLKEVLKRYPDLGLIVMGSKLPFSLPETQVVYVPWGEYSFFKRVVKGCDIGLAPLDNSFFNRRKSDLRIKELAIGGCAIVASDVANYRTAKAAGGFCVKTQDEWVEKITLFYEDEALRRKAQEQASRWAQSQGIRENIHFWLRVIKQEPRQFDIPDSFLKSAENSEQIWFES